MKEAFDFQNGKHRIQHYWSFIFINVLYMSIKFDAPVLAGRSNYSKVFRLKFRCSYRWCQSRMWVKWLKI